MGDDTESSNRSSGRTEEKPDNESLAEQLARILSTLQPQTQIHQTGQSVTINSKLNQTNYTLWARLMKMAIGGRGKLRHITGVPPAPAKGTLEYGQWEQTDLMVCSWILDNMEPDFVANYAEYPTASHYGRNWRQHIAEVMREFRFLT